MPTLKYFTVYRVQCEDDDGTAIHRYHVAIKLAFDSKGTNKYYFYNEDYRGAQALSASGLSILKKPRYGIKNENSLL